jgi:hypothetical protein
MSEFMTRRTALTAGIGLSGGMGFLMSAPLASAAGNQPGQHPPGTGGPVANSLAASVGN